MGRIDEPLELDPQELDELFSWFDLGWRVLDEVMAERAGSAGQSTVQLWPEHFDAGTALDLGDGAGGGVNLGFSPGDAFSDEPYVYVGPWGRRGPATTATGTRRSARPLPRTQVPDAAAGLSFIRTGLERLA